MSDILATHNRLIAAGVAVDRSRDFLRLVTEAEAGRLDRRAFQDHLASADYTPAQLGVLVEVLLQRLARKAGGGS